MLKMEELRTRLLEMEELRAWLLEMEELRVQLLEMEELRAKMLEMEELRDKLTSRTADASGVVRPRINSTTENQLTNSPTQLTEDCNQEGLLLKRNQGGLLQG